MKYLLIDSNARFRSFLREFITQDHDIFFELDEAHNLVSVFGSFKPDFVLMDMKTRNQGFSAVQQLKQAFPKARIIILSDDPDAKYKAKAFEAGAEAIIAKENLLELEQRIHTTTVI